MSAIWLSTSQRQKSVQQNNSSTLVSWFNNNVCVGSQWAVYCNFKGKKFLCLEKKWNSQCQCKRPKGGVQVDWSLEQSKTSSYSNISVSMEYNLINTSKYHNQLTDYHIVVYLSSYVIKSKHEVT